MLVTGAVSPQIAHCTQEPGVSHKVNTSYTAGLHHCYPPILAEHATWEFNEIALIMTPFLSLFPATWYLVSIRSRYHHAE